MRPGEILFIDDSSRLLRASGGLLRSQGYLARVVDTAEQALEQLSTRFFHLVVATLNAEPIDRVAVLQTVKELSPATRLIIISNNGRLPLDAFRIEVDDYIIMPCRSADFWQRIFQCLHVARTEPAPAEERSAVSNYGALQKLSVAFREMRRSLVAVAAGMKQVGKMAEGGENEDLAVVFHDTQAKIGQLISLTEGFTKIISNAHSPHIPDSYGKVKRFPAVGKKLGNYN